MTRILMIGPLSGPPGGATILFQQLVAELQAQPDVAVNVVDTSHSRSPHHWPLALVFDHLSSNHSDMEE